MADKNLQSITFPGLTDKYVVPQVDNTLTQAGRPADAKKTGDEISELKADFTQLDSKIAATQITNTASGAIASFPDGADGVPVKDLTVQITPVQDLHGQSNPYPGGGGKNLFGGEYNVKWVLPTPLSVHNGDVLTVSTSVPASGNPRINIYTGEGGATRWYNAGINDTVNNRKVKVMAFTEDVTFTAFMVDVAECTNIQIESGSTATAYAPYSNICPISGWTGANVVRTGKNLFVKPFAHISKAPNSLDECFPIKAGAYNLKVRSFTGATSWRFGIRMKDKDGNDLSAYTYRPSQWMTWNSANHMWLCGANNTELVWDFTIVEDCYIRVVFGVGDTTADTVANDAILGFGSTATDYEPSNAETYSVDWTDEAGTVYGGTLDVTSGVLTVDRASVDLGTLTWTLGVTNFKTFSATYSGIKYVYRDTQIICSKYRATNGNDASSSEDNYVWISAANTIAIKDTSKQEYTPAQFKESLSGVMLVYPLTTPQTYQLTPQEVSTLLGLNNIWADCGDTTVDYRADTKLYIEQLTAPTEDDMVANTNIPSDTYFMIGNTLFLSTTTIPAGDVINPGTNCTLMNLASALNALNS